MVLGVVLLTGCPQSGSPNGNDGGGSNDNGMMAGNDNDNTGDSNSNGSDNVNDGEPIDNDNAAPNANDNAGENDNDNNGSQTNMSDDGGSGNDNVGDNDNSAENTNDNTPSNTNDNAADNTNDNANGNANSNGNANANANDNTSDNTNDNTGGGGGGGESEATIPVGCPGLDEVTLTVSPFEGATPPADLPTEPLTIEAGSPFGVVVVVGDLGNNSNVQLLVTLDDTLINGDTGDLLGTLPVGVPGSYTIISPGSVDPDDIGMTFYAVATLISDELSGQGCDALAGESIAQVYNTTVSITIIAAP